MRKWSLSRIFSLLVSETRVYGSTVLSEGSLFVLQLLAYRFAGRLGAEGFSEYVLSRRAMYTLQTVVMVGTYVAVPRFIALSLAEQNKERAARFYGAGFSISIGFSLLCCLLMSVFSRQTAYLALGDASYSGLVLVTCWTLMGIVLHTVLYSYFRGMFRMNAANALQVLNIGVIPIAVFYMSHNVHGILWALGAIWVAISLAVTVFATPLREMWTFTWNEVSTLFRYGWTRLPGDVINSVLLSAPPLLAARLDGVKEAGPVGFAVMCIVLISRCFNPIATVMLPKVSRMLGEGEFHQIRRHVLVVSAATFAIAFGAAALLELLAPLAIRVYLGAGFVSTSYYLRLAVLGAPGYCMYNVLRSFIDSYHVKAYNTRNLVVSGIIFVVLSVVAIYTKHGSSGILIALSVAYTVLGLLTVWNSWTTLKLLMQSSEEQKSRLVSLAAGVE